MHDGCYIPEDLYYDMEHHVWIRKETEGWRIGMTDAAQGMVGPLAKITPKSVGTKVITGKALAIVESGKWVGPLPAPSTCKIVEINKAVEHYPGVRIVNRDPYGAGWIVKVEFEDFPYEEFPYGHEGARMYQEFLEKEGIRCKRD